MIALATRLISDYGRILAQLQPGLYGIPESQLPHDKSRIHEALVTVLSTVGSDPENTEIRESLIRGLVYLAQFVPDDEAALVAQGQHQLLNGVAGDAADPQSSQALRIINRIKLDMERAMDEAREILNNNARR